VTLSRFDYFEHGRSCTLWLDPESPDLVQVQAALLGAFPECGDLSNDSSRGITKYSPHLSVGQWKTLEEVQGARNSLQESWKPIKFTARHIALISRKSYAAPFKVRYVVPIGSDREIGIQRLDVPYVATTTETFSQAIHESTTSAVSMSSSFGLGSQYDGVWNFAYGANMAREKLSGARGLNPMESKPGFLRGYRLSFSHRGAMGNVVPAAEDNAVVGGACRAPDGVHGVLHRLTSEQMGALTNMEHEYWPMEVNVEAYDGSTIRAVVFRSPPSRMIKDGLPPITRYLSLLQMGARDWQLDKSYCQFLDDLTSVDSRERGHEYYSSLDGKNRLDPWPKIRVCSEKRRNLRRRGRAAETR